MPGRRLISKAVGIDLGTTNSAVALMDPSDTGLIVHRDANTGGETTPSCVWKDPRSGELIVGRKALRRMGALPQPIRSVKRLMGRQSKVRLTDEDVSPEFVSAAILREMRRQIEEDVAKLSTQEADWVVDRAIVTVPAYFDQPQIEATKSAAELAGLSVLDLLHEPTAAACFHCWRTNTRNGLFLVYDLGGGTFDVSVLRCTAGVFEVLGIAGNNRLGGDDLDNALAEDLRARLVRDDWSLELDPDDEEDELRLNLLRRMAESVKIGLSGSGEYLLRDAMGLRDKDGMPVTVEVMFDRPDLEHLIRPIVERTIPPCFDALEQAEARAGVRLADVDAIVLAGGSTHVPLVRQIVRDNLCPPMTGADRRVDDRADQPRSRCPEPVYEGVDTIVARGAAIRAAATGGLAVTNAAGTVRVSFRGLSATGATETHVGGVVEALDGGIDLSGGTIEVTIPEFNFHDIGDLGTGGVFAFRHLPLQPSAENPMDFEVRDASGAVVATAGRPVTQSDVAPPPTGGAGHMAVLSKDLSLEVLRGGQTVRKVVAKELTSLPHEADHAFLHPGDTEQIRIVLYQHRKKIKELPVQVPSSLPRGTPIALNISIDRLAYITVKGTIGDVPFSVAVVAPADREAPTADEMRALERKFAEALGYIAPGQQNVKRLQWEQARDAYKMAAQQGDAAGAVHEFEAMEELVFSLEDVPGPLTPPKPFLDNLVKDCYDLHRYVEQLSPTGTPYDGPEVVRSIDAQREQAERAYAASDQQAYTEAIAMLHHIEDHLLDVAGKINPPRPPSEAEDAAQMVDFGRAKAGKLRDIAAADRPDLARDIEDIDVELSRLAGQVDGDPAGVRERARPLLQNLSRIETILQGRRDGPGDLPEEA